MRPEDMLNYAIIDEDTLRQIIDEDTLRQIIDEDTLRQIIDEDTLRQIIMSQFKDDPMFDKDPIQEDLYIGYSEYQFENENQQAFLDAGHFYGLI